MQALRKNANLVALCVGVAVIAMLAIICAVKPEDFTFANTLWALLPPVVAIGLALITKEAYSSLFIGVAVGAMMHAKFNFAATVDTVVNDGIVNAASGTAGIFVFLVLLGALVALVNKTGASAAFGRWAQTHIKTKLGAYLATFVLGVLIFIDDYFNCLTVGTVMSPVTDTHKMSRVKLAYIIDATAAPICMIAPVSSWAAAVSGSVPEDFPISGIELFVRAIPFNFYSLLTFVFIITMAILAFDYGKMADFEIKAQNGELGILGENAEAAEAPNPRGRLWDLLIPVIVLVVACVLALLYVGGFFGTDAWGGTDYKGDFVGAFGNTDATIGLPWGALLAFILTIAYLICRRLINFQGAMDCIAKGFIAMVPAILILTFATALKNVTGLLGADVYVKGMMASFPETAAKFLPAVIFLVACVLAFATGTSWGTFGILIPIVTSMFGIDDPLLFVGISACLAGAVCGDHCSPISDTTIMASAGANCNHVDHVSTQLPYAVTVAGISFVCYILAGFVPNAWICLPVGAILTVATLFGIRFYQKKKTVVAE
ncbi:MAG: Na+/H+ antiporter NhaC family protein [Ruminococcaceae bacterium]|nr:Na+/H+ antiporter NhaC family protein [Oscillospiraceae bacterium]